MPPRQRSLRDMSRSHEEKHMYPSMRPIRCEEWSTLREMLPSSGRPRKIEPENWGTAITDPPVNINKTSTRNPMINSSMSRYVSLLATL